jgi:hypothetical protein
MNAGFILKLSGSEDSLKTCHTSLDADGGLFCRNEIIFSMSLRIITDSVTKCEIIRATTHYIKSYVLPLHQTGNAECSCKARSLAFKTFSLINHNGCLVFITDTPSFTDTKFILCSALNVLVVYM